MHYIIEAIIVGIYCLLLYYLFPINNFYIQLFIIGFIKHYLSYYIKLHDYYCNNGHACNNKNTKSINYNIFGQSILEAITFIIFGYIFDNILFDKSYTYFFIGFTLHILAENINLHKFFCNNYCFTIYN